MAVQSYSLEVTDELLYNQRFRVSEDVLYREVENEAILLNVPDGSYYSLNETCLAFWEAIRDEQPLNSAVQRLLLEYDVSRDQILQDLSGFLQSLMSFNLVTLK